MGNCRILSIITSRYMIPTLVAPGVPSSPIRISYGFTINMSLVAGEGWCARTGIRTNKGEPIVLV